jgi:hypothetical protein
VGRGKTRRNAHEGGDGAAQVNDGAIGTRSTATEVGRYGPGAQRLPGKEKPPPEWGSVCEALASPPGRPPPGWQRNPHRSGEVIARGEGMTQSRKGSGRNPHRSGEVFARRQETKPMLRDFEEKPPPKWGGDCEDQGWLIDIWHTAGETPTGAGRCLQVSLRISRTASLKPDKPPPEWVHRHLPPSCQGSCPHYSTQL